MKVLQAIFISLLLISFYSCDKDDPEVIQTEFTGLKVDVGDGHAWSYIETDEELNPISIGVKFDKDALVNLPTGSIHGDEFLLNLSTEISIAPYDHITLDWNEHGHDPNGVYDIPHFDFHFYFMSESERDLISPFDSIQFNEPLAAEHLAPLYLETPGGVPRMGAHIIDLMSPEIAGTDIFKHTFLYGKYDAEINFLEPMITKDFLESKTTIDKEIRHPESWQKSGYYPSRYLIEYDEATKVYSILLKDLVKF